MLVVMKAVVRVVNMSVVLSNTLKFLLGGRDDGGNGIGGVFVVVMVWFLW